jgi:hypothetical protein
VRREDSRDPFRLGAAIARLVATQGWEASAAGGSVMDRWGEIAPEMAETGNVLPVAFDAERHVLTLRPSNNAFGTQLRLFGQQLIVRINTAIGAEVVKELRVLPPGNIPIPRAQDSQAPPRADDDPVPELPRRTKTRQEAHPGYHQAREILLAGSDRRPKPVDRHEEKRARYFAGAYTRAPEEDSSADPHGSAGARKSLEAEQTRRGALQRARRERAEQTHAIGRVFDTTA